MLDTEPLAAQAPKPSLHLVAYEEATPFANQRGRAPEVAFRRDDIPSHTLDSLGEEGGGFAVGHRVDGFFEVADEEVFMFLRGSPRVQRRTVDVGGYGVDDAG